MSCRPEQFEQQFELLVNRSRNALLDVKLVMENNKVKYLDEATVLESGRRFVRELVMKQSEIDLERQLERGIQSLALVPDVLARTRKLDITSNLDTIYDGYLSGDRVWIPTQSLQFAAMPYLQRLRLNWTSPRAQELNIDFPKNRDTLGNVSSLSLCNVCDLERLLPRFIGVIDLSLHVNTEETPITLADIFT